MTRKPVLTPPTRALTTPRKLKTPEPPTPLVNPKKACWGRNQKADLETAFRLYNPTTDQDWVAVAHVLPAQWTIEELKAKARSMGLEPLVAPADTNESTELVDRLKKLMRGGKIPKKGTLKREEFEETIVQLMFQRSQPQVKQNGTINDTFDDSDTEFYQEAIRSHALDFPENPNKFVTPSKRAFVAKPISVTRDRKSLAAVEESGDDFSLIDSCKQVRFRRQFRAQQFNRRFGHNLRIQDEDDEPDPEQSTSRPSVSPPPVYETTFDEIDEF